MVRGITLFSANTMSTVNIKVMNLRILPIIVRSGMGFLLESFIDGITQAFFGFGSSSSSSFAGLKFFFLQRLAIFLLLLPEILDGSEKHHLGKGNQLTENEPDVYHS